MPQEIIGCSALTLLHLSCYAQVKLDGIVKSPDAALRFIFRHCGVRRSTPHSSGFARLACGHFTKPSHFFDF
jgi:hypothetical protein